MKKIFISLIFMLFMCSMVYADCYVPDPVGGQHSRNGTYNGYFRIALPLLVNYPTKVSMKVTVFEEDPFDTGENSDYVLFISGFLDGASWETIDVKAISSKVNMDESIYFGIASNKNVIIIGNKSWDKVSIKVSDVVVSGSTQTTFSYWDNNWVIQPVSTLGMTPHYSATLNSCVSYSWDKIINIPTDIANRNADRLDGLDSTHYLGVTGKAADSDKLDGKDSTYFVTASSGIAYDSVRLGGVAASSYVTGTSGTAYNSYRLGGLLAGSYLTTNSGTAYNSARFGGQYPSYYLTSTGTASDSYKLGGVPASSYLTEGETAYNSDKLGGFPSSAYLKTSGTAYDSSRLGGLPASSYVTSTSGTVSNSDKLDNLDSTYFLNLENSNGYLAGTYIPVIYSSSDPNISYTLDPNYNRVAFTRIGRVVNVHGHVKIVGGSLPIGAILITIPVGASDSLESNLKYIGTLKIHGQTTAAIANLEQEYITIDPDEDRIRLNILTNWNNSADMLTWNFSNGSFLTFSITYISH